MYKNSTRSLREIYTYCNNRCTRSYILVSNLVETLRIVSHVDSRRDLCYHIHVHTISTRSMHDYDASYIWDYETSSHDDLDESYVTHNIQDTYDLDEDYARDSHDYTQLAYMHYA